MLDNVLQKKLYTELEIPKEYRDKKISKISGSTGPGFMCSFGSIFDSEKTIAEAIHYHNKRFGSIKGLSLYVPSDKIWLVFVFGKFSSIKLDEPKASLTINGELSNLNMELK